MVGVGAGEGGVTIGELVGDPAAAGHEMRRPFSPRSYAPFGAGYSFAESNPRLEPWAAFLRRSATEPNIKTDTGDDNDKSAEHVFHFAEQRPQHRLVVDFRQGIEFLQ